MKDESRPDGLHPSSFILHPSHEAYGAFAYAYDAALGDRFFRSVRTLLTRVLNEYAPTQRTHLDLACGSGLAMRFFKQKGFASMGVDLSLPMLQMARRRATRLVAADIRFLPLAGTFGVITCLYDSLNHLDELTSVFACVREAMGPDSVFVFDMNDPAIYPVVWGMDEPFVARGRDFELEIATRFVVATGRGHARVRGWAMRDGRRVDIREEHEQRAFTREEIVDALSRTGLHPVDVIDFDPFGEARRVKLFFVCRAK